MLYDDLLKIATDGGEGLDTLNAMFNRSLQEFKPIKADPKGDSLLRTMNAFKNSMAKIEERYGRIN